MQACCCLVSNAVRSGLCDAFGPDHIVLFVLGFAAKCFLLSSSTPAIPSLELALSWCSLGLRKPSQVQLSLMMDYESLLQQHIHIEMSAIPRGICLTTYVLGSKPMDMQGQPFQLKKRKLRRNGRS